MPRRGGRPWQRLGGMSLWLAWPRWPWWAWFTLVTGHMGWCQTGTLQWHRHVAVADLGLTPLIVP